MAGSTGSDGGSAAATALTYLSGFGNEHQSEALPDALPVGQRSPQRPAYGLYTEQLSGTAFTAPRGSNRRTWFYRLRPSVSHGPFSVLDHPGFLTSGYAQLPATPAAQLRWNAFAIPAAAGDFLDGITTLGLNGNAALQSGVAVHVYRARRSMTGRYLRNADGEMLIVPQLGALQVHTECGILAVRPGEIALIPRGMTFRVMLDAAEARGYICENYGQPFRLPERGPIGSDGLANERDFLAPVAAFEDSDAASELVLKFAGQLHRADLPGSPLDVVAWWGNHVPYKYDLMRFTTIGTVSVDHPDPSIYTVLTAPSDTPGVANCDLVVFPPRWMVAESSFRPPPFHRNVMSEFMGLIHGQYIAKPDGFLPGGASLHNSMLPHGPSADVFAAASTAELSPEKVADTLAFMFESRYLIAPTALALEAPELQSDYASSWVGLDKHFDPGRARQE